MFFALRGRKVRHIGGFLESRRDDRAQTGVQASGYDATTKEAPTERQRHRLFLSPFQGFVLLMSQSRGLTPPSVVFRTFGASPRNCNKNDELLAGLQIIAVWGKACAPQLMLLFIGFPDEKQLMGAYSKVPKGRETTDGGGNPR